MSERKTHDEELMVRYLLGELSEGQRIQFEEDCFADDQCFEQLVAVEAELTDDYVGSNLVGLRRERFEKKMLSTAEGRGDVEFARIITGAAADSQQAAVPVLDQRRADGRTPFAWLQFRGRAWQFSLAAIALVLVGLGLWSVWSYRQRQLEQQQLAQQSAPPASPAPVQSPQPGPSPGTHQATASPEPPRPRGTPLGQTPPAPQPAIVSLLLVPGFDRSVGGANDLVIPADARMVRLQLAFEGDSYRSYRAVLRSVEGKETFRRGGLKGRVTRSGRNVTLELPAGAFPEGDFILTLSGATAQGEEEINKYFLSVRKK